MNATIKLVHAHFDADHLEAVKAEMAKLGSPTIHAVDLGDGLYQALEGCHRVRAAAALGIPVAIELVEYSDALVSSVVDGFDSDHTIEQLCDDCRDVALIKVEVA
jgi:hypothetical protein